MASKLFVAILFLTFSCIFGETGFCGDGQFQCKNGQCIDEEKYCDFTIDCADWSDEDECGLCDFSGGKLCGWNNTGLKMDNININSRPYDALCIVIQHTGSVEFSLDSPILPRKMAKHCRFETFIGKTGSSGGICHTTATMYIDHREIVGEAAISVSLGYNKAGFQVLISGNLVDTCGLGNRDFVDGYICIVNASFHDCNPKEFPIDCDFKDNHNCTWWFDSTRFDNKWIWNEEGYIYNEQAALAELRSPLIEPPDDDGGACLSFSYFIDDGTGNVLHVTQINLASKQEETIWSSSQPTNDEWQRQSLFIDVDFDIDVGFLSSSTNGMVAITNVTYAKGACDDDGEVTTSSTVSSTSELPTSSTTTPSSSTLEVPTDGACTFETMQDRNELCGFHFEDGVCIKSQVVSRSHEFTGTGPEIDHTLGINDGWFLNFESDKNCTDGQRQVKFVLPNFHEFNSPRCLYFWYQLRGDSSLSVALAPNSSGAVRLWRTSQQVEEWKFGGVLLEADDPFDILFIADFNSVNDDDSFISIDDIVIEQGYQCN